MHDANIFDRPVYALLGLPVDAVTVGEACSRLLDSVQSKSRCFFTTPNLNYLVATQTDSAFRDSLIDSDLVVADGMPLVRIAKLLGIPLPERVAGSTVFDQLRLTSRPEPLGVYFFGGPEGVADRACKVLNRERLGMVGVGALYPGFGSLDDMLTPKVFNAINDQRVDLLVVSLGAKRGQAWIQSAKKCLQTSVVANLGAVVNFVAGSVVRAPDWIQRMGMEWLWRVYQEPSLFNRYFSDGTSYLWLLFKHVLPLRQYQRKLTIKYQHEPPGVVTLNTNVEFHAVKVIGVANSILLPATREVFKNILNASPTRVEIDLSNCRYFNAAFLGQIMLHLKIQRSRNQPLLMKNPSSEVKKLIELHAATYLL